LNKTTSTKYIAPAKTQPKADQPFSWLSQERKEKYFSIFSELGVLCVFARVVSFPTL
jgi:hypothetical protein